jgi:hypothetical protein
MEGTEGIPNEWYFITAPQQVSWSKDSSTTTIDAYGTNNPYLQYGTTQLRKLTLGDSMIEGFSDAKQVEGNIRELENCMRIVIDTDSGFASPFCWEVFAAGKSYGYYIITGVNITEEMRDNSGYAVRAKADISLQEVSAYQVSTGEDITGTAITGGLSEKYEKMIDEKRAESQKDSQDKKVDKEKPKGDYKVGDYEYDAATGRPVSGPGISEGPKGSGANTTDAFDKAPTIK